MKNSTLLNRNAIYRAIYEQMLAYSYAYLGGYIFKSYVRRKRPSEDSTIYMDVIKNTVAQPICRYIVDTINDVLFEPGVKRDLRFCTPEGIYISPDNNEWIDMFLSDADFQNRSLTGFMETVGNLTSIFGHCWVFVDMPLANEGNLGRPYVCALSPLDVWDWEFETYGGRPILKYIKVKESENEENYYIKCYHLGDATMPSRWESYEVPKVGVGDAMEQEAELLSSGTFPAGMMIPGFIAYGRQDTRTSQIGISDIDSASDAQREYYKLECEAYSSLQFAHTIIRAENGISIPVHAGAIVRALAGQVEAISVETGDVDMIIKKQQDILEQIEALTGLGGLRNSKNQVASGVAIIEERKQLHRIAKSKARLMEVTEEMILTFAARFMEQRWAGEVNYNTDYEAHDINYRLALIRQAKDMVGDDPLIKAMITKEIVGMLAPDDDVLEYENTYIATIPEPAVQDLLTKENKEVHTADLGSQIPIDRDVEDPNENENQNDNATLLGGAGTPIQNVGITYYPQQAIAVQLTGINVGR